MKFRYKIPLLIALLVLCSLNACQKSSKSGQGVQTATATIRWTGEVAADGCGFEVLMQDHTYLPLNEDAIDASFKQHPSTAVKLQYEHLPEPIDRRCGMVPQPRFMDAIRIVSVERL